MSLPKRPNEYPLNDPVGDMMGTDGKVLQKEVQHDTSGINSCVPDTSTRCTLDILLRGKG